MRDLILFQSAAFIIGFIVDFFVGDPHGIPHPICLIGNLIAKLDKALHRGKSPRSDFLRGLWMVVIVVLLSTAVPFVIAVLAWTVSPWLYLAVESVMCWQILAARQLVRESVKVQRSLEKGDIKEARYNVSMIVGRDTERLDDKGITRAAVETVAENTSDGVIAPMIFIFLFGAAGGFFYKSVNTMDSMVGYKNDKYLYFGRAAARLDDFVNFIPSRLSALLLILASPLVGQSASGAFRIFKRDRLKHASPNSAQTESVCAGSLGIRLAGDAWYGGKLHKKDYIGDAKREIDYKDITRVGRLMYAAAILTLVLLLGLRAAVVFVCL